jgi:hypothetical protein
MRFNWHNIRIEEYVLLILALSFLSLGIGCVLFLFLSRIVKNYNIRKKKRLQAAFQQSLNSILFNEDSEMPEASYRFHLNQIKKIMGNSIFARHTIVGQILGIKKSLSGSASKRLDRVYRDLDLIAFSMRKLTSWSWKNRAQGIRELTEVNYYDRTLFQKVKSRTKNQTLLEEIFMSTVRLDNENPLSFFDGYQGDVSDWMRINIYRYLSFRDIRTLPQFSNWFRNENKDVVIFAVGMAKQFRQMSAINGLIDLLRSDHAGVIDSAINALAHLNAFQAVHDVLAISDRWRNNAAVSHSIVRFLSVIATDETQIEKLFYFLDHPSLSVRLDATHALCKAGSPIRKKLELFNMENDGKWNALIAHASEPLLQ